MELTSNKITERSTEISEIQNWVNLEKSDALNFIFTNKKPNFKQLVANHLSNKFVSPFAYTFKHNGEVVGLVLLSVYKNRINNQIVCNINDIVVHPECRNLGVGAHMLADIIDNKENILGKKQYDTIIATINKNNHPSIKLFKKMGFEIDLYRGAYTAFYSNKDKILEK